MAELKTKLTTRPVQDFLNEISSLTRREDCFTICKLMEEVTKSPAKMWGDAIVGVGDYRYQYASGRSGDWFMMGFSPRKLNISLYILGCSPEKNQEVMSRLGKHKASKGCLYIKTLADINMDVLRELCETSYQKLKVS